MNPRRRVFLLPGVHARELDVHIARVAGGAPALDHVQEAVAVERVAAREPEVFTRSNCACVGGIRIESNGGSREMESNTRRRELELRRSRTGPPQPRELERDIEGEMLRRNGLAVARRERRVGKDMRRHDLCGRDRRVRGGDGHARPTVERGLHCLGAREIDLLSGRTHGHTRGRAERHCRDQKTHDLWRVAGNA